MATHALEFGNLLDIPDNYPKLVVSMDPITGAGHKAHPPPPGIREFLLTEW